MIETSSKPPLKALKYLTAECNYGGRVTDDRDRRTIITLLGDFYCQEVLSSSQEGYNFCGTADQSTQRFKVKHCPDLESCLNYARDLPDECSPLVVGLHPNATINLAILEADRLLG
jgi:dynein heavy chain